MDKLINNQRRVFIKHTLTGIIGLSVAGSLPGFGQKSNLSINKSKEIKPKKMIVKKLNCENTWDIEKAAGFLEKNSEFQIIDTINWPSFSYKPDVKFKIGYCQNQILLKYYVSEKAIKATETKLNGDVYKDSCVEFFISINRDTTYYNFEFNCVGIPHLGYHQAGKDTILIDPGIIKLIQVKSSLGNLPFEEKTGEFNWELMVIIPKECFAFDKNLELNELMATANFYNCGDGTSIPHYISWNPIETTEPSYHQPKFFGEIQFEK
jgi:hypothetical protein